MKNLILFTWLSAFSVSTVNADQTENDTSKKLQQVTELHYIEREPGVDDYEVTMLVSDRYIRVDELGESSGFIIYDDKKKTIYSVSHQDKSVLVINEKIFTDADAPAKHEIEYLQLADAPKVSGHDVFNYRVFTGEKGSQETCLEVQLAENLLLDVARLLKNYQNVISGQQVKMTDNKVSEMQTACYFIDQVYNKGLYYDKGLPIQEWHSNDRSKILASYKEVEVAKNTFMIPDDYRQFSVDNDSKSFIQ